MEAFVSSPGFCPICGSIFPHLKKSGEISCYSCENVFKPEAFGSIDIEYTIHFNSYDTQKSKKVKTENDELQPEGPVIDRKCPKCGNDKMSYATLQLRSADEGQTVFFTCLKCKYKESENS